MSEAINALRHEHEAILMALRILDSISAQVRAGKVSKEDVTQFLGFLREFADTCHHGKEERLLFPAMLEAGSPMDGGPVSVMLAEHARGRELVAEMTRASTPNLQPAAFQAAASAYATHLRQHIDKENAVLFPMAEALIPDATLERLFNQFEQHEEEVMGHGRHEELHALLTDLRSKYLP